ncbi:MAG: hypothetical protein E7510_09730 [Ruminococcus sp.]|nr:hypothetical protein [Ruminococcus sp.]
MRIEIGVNSNGASLKGYQTDFSSLLDRSDALISSVSAVKKYIFMMNGGVGVLQGALDLVDTRLTLEKGRKNDLVNMQDKVAGFIEIVRNTDNAVSQQVSKNQNEFYAVYPWAKPSVLSSWYNNACNWLKGALRGTCSAIDNVWKIYNGTDYRTLSDDELNRVCDEYIRIIDCKDESTDFKIKLQALLDYLSTVYILETPSKLNKKIDLYVKVYEKIYPDKAESMRNLFSDAPLEFENDVRNIKFIAYKSTGECHDIFFKYACRLKIADYYCCTEQGETKNFFNPNDDSMYLNMKSIRDRNNLYGTFFHEAGHNIDLLMGMDATGNKKYYSAFVLSDGNFHGLVYKEVEGIVTNLVNNYSNNEKFLNDEQKSLITDVLMGRKHDSEINNSDTDFAYRKVLEDITGAWKGKYSRKYQNGREIGILEAKDSGALSEVMNGMTNNSLMVNSKYTRNVDKGMLGTFNPAHVTAGHPINWGNPIKGYVGTDYYYDSNGLYTGSAETEYMAEYMRINMTNSVSEKEYITRYLGDSWGIMTNGLKYQNIGD